MKDKKKSIEFDINNIKLAFGLNNAMLEDLIFSYSYIIFPLIILEIFQYILSRGPC